MSTATSGPMIEETVASRERDEIPCTKIEYSIESRLKQQLTTKPIFYSIYRIKANGQGFLKCRYSLIVIL